MFIFSHNRRAVSDAEFKGGARVSDHTRCKNCTANKKDEVISLLNTCVCNKIDTYQGTQSSNGPFVVKV